MHKSPEKIMRELARDQERGSLNLQLTKGMIEVWRTLKNRPHESELAKKNVQTAFEEIGHLARLEWGDAASVDDFSVPNRIVIRAGSREEII